MAATRNIKFNLDKLSDRIQSHLSNHCAHQQCKLLMERWRSLGYLPSSQAEYLKSVEKLAVAQRAPVTQQMLSIPHPVRCFDLNGLMAASTTFLADAQEVVMAAAFNESMSLMDIELLALDLERNPYLNNYFPKFASLMSSIGAGSLFTTLCPLIHNIKNAPVFSFTPETCSEIISIDIAKGIDASYLHAPTDISYFHISDSMGMQVHDGETGFHELEGFYLYESNDHCFELDDVTLKALGLNPNEPYRALTIVLVGAPKETGMNDTLTKIEFFLQDGQDINDMIERTAAWHSGEVITTDIETCLDLGELSNHLHDSSNMNVGHNVRLLRVAVNFIAYLGFAKFRRTELKDRELATQKVLAKKGDNRKKAAKKITGKSDQIIIQTNNAVFTSGASAYLGYKKSPHFRRGFLRNQRYGSGDNIHHKPVFIAPTMVAQDGERDGEIQNKNYIV
ncbi:hypothetical protein ACNO5E_14260 [Vibrio parahaemolyticus]|uniref:hypothetical protein n=1 Tax=Vibrio parahaemolyticus TaxID=670 RepID=UPI0008136D49|nr:hypothetical protein [Vibrio parahaemolyticus]OCP68470.1 hypothetical protein AKH08_16810 [Vibrio parahaemolyticus]